MRSTHLRWTLVVATVVVAVTAAGCGSEADTTAGLSPEIARLIDQEATESQRPYLEDGVVTPSEREAAFFAMVACMKGNGVDVTDYTLRNDGETIRTMTDLDDAAEEQVVEDCRSEEYFVVAAVFREQNAPSAQDEVEWVRQAAACMRDQGIEPPEDPTLEDLLAIDPLMAGNCYDAARGG